MNFNFIPYKLNADISYFKKDIQYISSDNGVDLYKARKGLKTPILSIPISDVNLYFFEGNLITVYIHLALNPENLGQVSEILASAINGQAKALRIDSGMLIGWPNETDLLGLVSSGNCEQLYLYYSLRKYSIYEVDFS